MLYGAALVAALAFTASAGSIQDPDMMVGGGWIDNPDILGDPTARIHTGLHLNCDALLEGSNMEITFRTIDNPDIRSRFHLSELVLADCAVTMDESGKRVDGTHIGTGTGLCNGQMASATWTLTDSPGRLDSARLEIEGAAPGCSLTITGFLSGGNLELLIDNPDL